MKPRLGRWWQQRHRLGTRLVLATVVQVVLVGSTIGGMAWVAGRRSGLVLAEALRQQHTVTNLADSLSQQLQAPQQINRLNILAIAQGDLQLTDFDGMTRRFWRLMQLFPVSYINWGGTDGTFLGVERRDDGSLVVNEDSHRNPAGRGSLAVYALEQNGRRGALLELVPGMEQLHQEAWYTETVKAGRATWSSIYQWEDQPQTTAISYNEPVYSSQGRLLGVIGVDFALSQLSSRLAELWRDRKGAAVILEPNGMVVASSRGPITRSGPEGLRRARIDQLDDPLLRAASSRVLQGGVVPVERSGSGRPRERLESVNLRNTTYLLDLHPWGKQEGLNWLLLTAAPADPAVATSQSYLLLTLALSAGAILTATWLTRLTILWLLAPLEQLRQNSRLACEQLERGGMALPYDHLLGNNCATEIIDLSCSFAALVNPLQQNEARLRQLLDGLPVPVAVLEPETRTWQPRFTNRAFQQTLGDQVQCCDPDQQQQWQAHRLAISTAVDDAPTHSTAAAESIEILLRRADGAELTVLVFGCWCDNALVEAYLDLTAIRRTQAELAESLARERLKEAHMVQLLQAKLRSSLGGAAIAHEINLPLSTLLLNSRILLGTAGSDLPADLRESLQQISAEAERMVQIIERMRALLRNVQTEQQPLALGDVVRSALLYLRPQLKAARVEVATHGLAKPAMVLGDSAQIHLALLNLLRNGIEAMEAAGHAPRQLRIALEPQSGGDEMAWVLSVEDNGPGFPAGLTSPEPLQSGKPQGCGLGLFVVRTTMENHRGTVQLGRSPNLKGAAAWLTFPAIADLPKSG
jgi:C4-dicarboxylate-specific signal transduction histidine kinase